MSTLTVNGYLVIGDISGYTSYVASTELEHSQAVLSELLELIVEHFQPMMTLAKLEGDAVFVHAPDEQAPNGERVLELIESTYVAFRDRIDGIVMRTTCTCNACRAIPTLDLKFMLHRGEYIVQEVSGIRELVGSDVNLLHRLTKNHVTEETGWIAYALFTDTCLDHMQVEPNGMHKQVESYEHLGVVETHVLDLRKYYKELKDAQHVFISPEEAHAELKFNLGAPPAIAWEWLNDPQKRTQVDPSRVWSSLSRPRGRTGVGARNHCAHGKSEITIETILDWRPFDYYTFQTENEGFAKIFNSKSTFKLVPSADGEETQVTWTMIMDNRLMKWLLVPLSKLLMKTVFGKHYQKMGSMLREEMGTAPQDTTLEPLSEQAGQ